MTVRLSDNGTIVLEGHCPVEDAEPLLQLLLSAPKAAVDWSKCERPHTAIVQALMAAGAVPAGICGDKWVAAWCDGLKF